MYRFSISVRIVFCLWVGFMSDAKRSVGQDKVEDAVQYPNLPIKTLGGKQFWTDFAWADGWRMQQNAITGHWRVLDPKNVRRAWGNRPACEAVIEKNVDRTLAVEQHVVVLLHGLLRSSASMAVLEKVIEKETGLRTVRFDYASTRKGIAEHAIALRQVLENLPGDPKIDFVCHSMGNIVVRHLLADLTRDGDPQNLMPRLRRMVMLGPPNQGADIARQLGKLGLFELVTGKGGMQLGPAWDEFQANLATPSFPFIIVAGDTGEGWLRNPAIGNASDLLVKLDEARLEGCEKFHVVPVIHSLLMGDKAVQAIVVDYLRALP